MITTFTRFDVANLFSQPARSLAQLGVIVALGLIQPLPGAALLTAVLTVSLTVATPFLVDERGRLDTLYGLLPLPRRDVVIGRYLTMLVYAVAAMAVGTLTTVVGAAARGQSLDWDLLGLIYLVSVLITAAALAVQLPTFFRWGFTRARFMMFAPMLVLAVIFVVLSRLGLLTAASLSSLTAINPVLALAGVLVISAALLVASATVSIRWYRARAL